MVAGGSKVAVLCYLYDHSHIQMHLTHRNDSDYTAKRLNDIYFEDNKPRPKTADNTQSTHKRNSREVFLSGGQTGGASTTTASSTTRET